MQKEEFKSNVKYQIMFKGKHSGRVATAIRMNGYGDVTLEFKNGSQVCYHITWLQSVEI